MSCQVQLAGSILRGSRRPITTYEKVVKLKLLVIGETYVGKTSLIKQLVLSDFNEATVTLGYDHSRTTRAIDGILVSMDIFDTAGQEQYHTMMPNFYRNADGALFVYDVTRPKTLDKLNSWMDELHQYAGRNDVVKFLVGNKVDMRPEDFDSEQFVSTKQGNDWAHQYGIQAIETSAKNAYNVDLAFMSITKLSREYQETLVDFMKAQREGRVPTVTSDSNVSHHLDEEVKPNKKRFLCF